MALRDKGTFFYSIAGIMVVILVLAVALYIMKTSHDPSLADSLRMRRFTDALYSMKTDVWSMGRTAEYPVVWRLGHDTDSNGVNRYLAMGEGGREQLRKDLLSGYADELNKGLSNRAVRSEAGVYSLDVDGILVNVSLINPEDISVTETSEGSRYVIKLHMEAASTETKYDSNTNVTVDSPFRLFDMFDRSYSFHKSYEGNVQWATTIALYTRAYMNGYNPSYEGSFLREGHVAYDPLEPFLEGDLDAVKEFSIDSIGDLGSVPVATWLTEWQALGEPAYVPPGTDLDLSLEGNTQILDLIKSNYDMSSATDCNTLSGEDKTKCLEFNDPTTINAKADQLKAETEKLKALRDRIESWKPTESMTCDQYKEEAEEIIEEIVMEFQRKRPTDEIINPAMDYATGTDLENEVKSNDEEIITMENAVSELQSLETSRLSKIGAEKCLLPEDMDCKCAKGPDDCDDIFDCLECDNPSCDKISCPPSTSENDYSCSSFDVGDYRKEKVECVRVSCDEVCSGESCSMECETEELEKNVKIDQCNCECHPDNDLIGAIKKQVDVIKEKINAQITDLEMQEMELRKRAATLEQAEKKFKEIENLSESSVGTGYDVVGELEFSKVSYYPTVGNRNCYVNPDWGDRLNGTCGNYFESTGLYTGQIAAAVVCCGMYPACCSAVDYVSKWFPVIYQVEGDYNITEKIVDDRNRVMMHNVFAGDGDLYGLNVTPKLYTYAAPEFVIYKDYQIHVAPQTGQRVLVYLYLPKMVQGSKSDAVDKILESFKDSSCKGVSC